MPLMLIYGGVRSSGDDVRQKECCCSSSVMASFGPGGLTLAEGVTRSPDEAVFHHEGIATSTMRGRRRLSGGPDLSFEGAPCTTRKADAMHGIGCGSPTVAAFIPFTSVKEFYLMATHGCDVFKICLAATRL